jgi:hypothetical protein
MEELKKLMKSHTNHKTSVLQKTKKTKLNSVALVRKRNIKKTVKKSSKMEAAASS